MAIPPLPLELVRLIVDQASDKLQERERHELGSAVALVQKSWRSPGQALAWHTVTVTLACDDPLLKHLLHHEQLLPFIKDLSILTREASRHETRRDTALTPAEENLIPRLLQRCTRLETVHLPDDSLNTPMLLGQLAPLPSAAKLHHLTAMVRQGTGLDGELFVNSLAAFTALRSLHLSIVEWIVSTRSRAPPSPFPAPLLNLVELDFNLFVGGHSGDSTRRAMLEAIFSLVNLSTLRHLTLNCVIRNDGPFLSASLPLTTSLVTLTLGSFDPEELAIVLPSLVQIFPRLSSLVDLKICKHRPDIATEGADVLTPVGLVDFLNSLPPRLRLATITGVYFADEQLRLDLFDSDEAVAGLFGKANYFVVLLGDDAPTRRVAAVSVDGAGGREWFDISDDVLGY
ncbi:hypothetical protein JCM1840_001107 [Sporobolomyces johnsonii]